MSGRNSGIYHGYPDVSQAINVLEVFTDSEEKRLFVHHVLWWLHALSASRTQKIVSLSSAEAEVSPCTSGCSDAILLGRILSWLTGRQTTIYAYTDSSGAKGIHQRSGVGTFETSFVQDFVAPATCVRWYGEALQCEWKCQSSRHRHKASFSTTLEIIDGSALQQDHRKLGRKR